MIGNNNLIWLIGGLIPYYINAQQMRNGCILRIHALFWSLVVDYQRGRNQWTVRVPLIERLRSVVWAAITHLQRDDPPQR